MSYVPSLRFAYSRLVEHEVDATRGGHLARLAAGSRRTRRDRTGRATDRTGPRDATRHTVRALRSPLAAIEHLSKKKGSAKYISHFRLDSIQAACRCWLRRFYGTNIREYKMTDGGTRSPRKRSLCYITLHQV